MSEECCKCGSRDLLDAEQAGADSVRRLRDFKKSRNKQETRSRLGKVGEGAFMDPRFLREFLATTVLGAGAVFVRAYFEGTLTVAFGVWVVLGVAAVASIFTFAHISHRVQKEIQAETDALAVTKRACKACGTLQP